MLDHFNSNFVIFRSYQKSVKCEVNINISYCCANSLLSLERKMQNTLVSFSIQNDLGLDTLNFISAKISKSPGILSRLRNFVSQLQCIA